MAYLPWDQINELLLYAGAAEDGNDFIARLLGRLGDLLPWDAGAGLFGRDLRCSACRGWDAATFDLYNGHYREKLPFILYDGRGAALRGLDVVPWDRMPDCEFVRDFAGPLRLRSGLSPFRPDWPLVLSLQRTADLPPFSARDCAVLDVVNAHAHNLLELHARIANAPSNGGERATADAWKVALRAAFRLSPRELDVLECLCEGLSNRAIARELGIGERTVKTHLTSAFEKTRCRSRLELAALARRPPARKESRG